jgi:hypothetical protein
MHSELSFILAGGPVSISVAIILVVMSLLSWFVIIERSISLLRERYAQKAFIAEYAACNSLVALQQIETASVMAELAKRAFLAAEQADKNNHISAADKAAIKGVIHKKTAARKKSKLTKLVNTTK